MACFNAIIVILAHPTMPCIHLVIIKDLCLNLTVLLEYIHLYTVLLEYI